MEERRGRGEGEERGGEMGRREEKGEGRDCKIK